MTLAMPRLPRPSSLWFLALLLFAACDRGGEAAAKPANAASSTAAEPEVVTRAEHIVAGNTAAAEYLRLLVEPARVAAIPEQVADNSVLPFDQQGWEDVKRFARYSADPILAAGADVVLTHAWQEAETTSVLRSRDVPVLVLASARGWSDIERTLVQLGKVLHAEEAAAKLVLSRGNTVERLAREAKRRPRLSGLVYSNDGTGGWIAAADTTADAALHMAGLTNAAEKQGLKGHVQIDFEKLLVLDPDILILTAPRGGQKESSTRHTLANTAVLANLRAVKEQRYVEVSDALLSSDSLTLVEAADTIALGVGDVLQRLESEKLERERKQ